jgi:hypothetical protein
VSEEAGWSSALIHKKSGTFEAREAREIVRATGSFLALRRLGGEHWTGRSLFAVLEVGECLGGESGPAEGRQSGAQRQGDVGADRGALARLQQPVLAEFARVLRPGGAAVLSRVRDLLGRPGWPLGVSANSVALTVTYRRAWARRVAASAPGCLSPRPRCCRSRVRVGARNLEV